MYVRAAWALGFVCLTLQFAVAQEQAGQAPAAAQDNAAQENAAKDAAANPKQAEFDKQMVQWKKIIGRMRELGAEYQTAPQADRPKLVEEFEKLRKEGEAMKPTLVKAAEEAYAAEPNKNPEVAMFMASLASDAIARDDFDAAKKVGAMLLEKGYDDKRIYDVLGVAAFGMNDFDAAEKNLKLAEENKVLSDTGRRYLGLLPEYKAKWEKEKALRDAEAKADDLPRVKLKTTKGDITIELFENEAPQAVANFISLVEKKPKGFYDGLTFHRVLPGFMAQGGDPKGDGSGGPGYTIACECYEPNHREHFRGTLSMAHAGRDTGGSQFFLTFLPTPHLDGKHTVFGRVIEGMDVLPKLQRRNPEAANEPDPDKIIEATVVRKRDHTYEPKKLPERG